MKMKFKKWQQFIDNEKNAEKTNTVEIEDDGGEETKHEYLPYS